MFKILLILTIFALTFPLAAKAQVAINEVLPNPPGEDDGSEWVELYNTTSQIVPLLGCTLFLHETNNSQSVVFGEGDFVEKYKVISWDKSWLNNSGDQIRLECETFSDSIAYGSEKNVVAPSEGKSLGRSPDGTGSFYVLSSVTLGEANSAPPTSTSIPTNTATVTSEPTSTLWPTNEPTRIMTSIIKPTEEENDEDDLSGHEREDLSSEVLSTSGENEVGQNSDQVNDGKKNNRTFPIASAIFILIGLSLIGFPAIRYLRMKKQI